LTAAICCDSAFDQTVMPVFHQSAKAFAGLAAPLAVVLAPGAWDPVPAVCGAAAPDVPVPGAPACSMAAERRAI